MTILAISILDFIVDKVKVNMPFNFSQDVIFANALLKVDGSRKQLALHFLLTTHHSDDLR